MARPIAFKNLDVLETSPDQIIQETKGSATDFSPGALLSVVHPRGVPSKNRRRPYSSHGSKHLTLAQATNIIEAVNYARAIGLPLVAHASIHWSGTVAFDDPDGKLFAKVREGLHKWLLRRGIPGGLTCIWCRECKAHTDIVHCHLLFHLPANYRRGARFLQTEAVLFRLVGRHGGGILGEFAVKLVIHPDPDGLYLIKGGDRYVWERFKIRKEWRKSQGILHGQRCGTTGLLDPLGVLVGGKASRMWPEMPRPRQRVCLESGLKLDLNRLRRQGLVGPGCRALIRWTSTCTGEEIASGLITSNMEGKYEGRLRIQLGDLDQTIILVPKPRHLGGYQWYFVCPVMNRYSSVLWMPPGAKRFCSRQAWGRRVAYASQFLDPDNRAHRGKAKIKARLIADLDPNEWELPPKPKWMRWSTYNRLVDRFDSYEEILERGIAELMVKLLGKYS